MSTEGGGVFVSYRRDDSGDVAGRLADRLINRFGAERMFIDVETIEPGADYVEAITDAVEACAVLLAVIGPGWLTAADGRGRRLDDPHDLVRVEVGTALARGVRVIPVLVAGAVMPAREDLPDGLAGLARRNALPVRRDSFRDDARRLIAAVERVLASVAAAASAPDVPPAGGAPGKAADNGTGVSEDDLARVARLFGEAERIACSITDESSRGYVLIALTGVVAATDPVHAEAIANSITHGYLKARALSGVASAVAATDPGRAETIANSITDKSWKEHALSGVASAVAATDPGRAETIANSITDRSVKSRALIEVASAVAATDPDRAARLLGDAERAANSITNESEKEQTLIAVHRAVASAVAATDPGRAEAIANSITDGSSKALALGDVAGAVAAADPGRAETIANSITDELAKARALANVASAVASTDPGRAEVIASAITNAIWQARALASIANVLISD